MTRAITHNVPPQRLIHLLNPFVRFALRSPLHVVLDPALLTLHITGRVSGRRYDIPVGYVDLEGHLVVVTQHVWRVNLRGGCDVEVTHEGGQSLMHAELDEEPSSVARTLWTIIDRIGWKAARSQLGLSVTAHCTPTVAALEDAVRDFHLATITLTPAPGVSPDHADDVSRSRKV